MRPRRGKVELYFTDRDGLRWRVYEFSFASGRRTAQPIGTLDGTYRGFERLDGVRELRTHLLVGRDEVAHARILSVDELQRELDASFDHDAPGGPVMPKPRHATSDGGHPTTR